jgi:hypothetical protein
LVELVVCGEMPGKEEIQDGDFKDEENLTWDNV